MTKKVLIVEDNKDISHLVSIHLADLNYAFDIAHDGRKGLSLALTNNFDLIILDLMLPELDGIQVCRELRAQNINTPILMLTAKSSELDRVLGLEIGADDYLTKPFSIRELMARVNAIFRRADTMVKSISEPESNELEIGKLILDSNRRSVEFDGMAIELTAKEFDLLWYFAHNPGRVFTRTQLLDRIWGYSHDGYEHTVNSHINRLRSKFEKDPANPEYILTVWGVGYKFFDWQQNNSKNESNNSAVS
ncbi:MAG: response regulator transcription factor [Gammaproteobacteria bacterium]